MKRKNNRNLDLDRIIYKIIKPSDPMTVYIGQTSKTKEARMKGHYQTQRIHPNFPVYQWLDDTCYPEVLESFNGPEDIRKEMDYVEHYQALGYTVTNKKIKIKSEDPIAYIREHNRRAIEKGLVAISNKKNAPKHNANKTSEYNNWRTTIYNRARKDNLIGYTFKELLTYYNEPPFQGEKTKEDLPCKRR